MLALNSSLSYAVALLCGLCTAGPSAAQAGVGVQGAQSAEQTAPGGGSTIWRCGNLLTNVPALQGHAKADTTLNTRGDKKGECRLINLDATSVTVNAWPTRSRASGASPLGAEPTSAAPARSTQSTSPMQGNDASLKNQMAKDILSDEHSRLSARQLKLQEQLQRSDLSPLERERSEQEMRRNAGDLLGLRREISKLP